jgi:hypothetical protein
MKDNEKVKMEDVFDLGDSRQVSKSSVKSERQSPSLSVKKSKKSESVVKRLAIIIGAIVVLGVIAWGVYSSVKLSNMQNPEYIEQQSKAETQAIVDKVSKLIELPEGEPVLATVSDKAQLEGQPFFEKAENGDKVLIFTESSIAIIYRESTDKIINSGPIAITSDEVVEDQQ